MDNALNIQLTAIFLSGWFYRGMVIAYFVTVFSCVTVVVSENRNPIRSLAWIVALLFLPVIGLVFYLFFGRSLKGQQMLSRHAKRRLLHKYTPATVRFSDTKLKPAEKQLVKLAYSLTKSPYTENNVIETFYDGRAKFESLKRDLEMARESIYLQYYIFSDDKLGTEIAEILKRKAQEGLSVKVMYDHIGSLNTRGKFFKDMRRAGVDVHPFFKVTFPQLANRINWRNHRKIVVIDNRVGYIGGMNIADRYVGDDVSKGWRDTHFRVEGDIVTSLLYSFAVDWYFLRDAGRDLNLEVPYNAIVNNCGCQMISDGPVHTCDNLALCFQKAISAARKSIYIQTPYFLPTDALMHALQAAAMSQVDVRVMIPRRCDSILMKYASYSYVSICLSSNIKVYLYEPEMLHAKVMVVDDNFVTAGSANFDFRSFENNFECNLMIYDAELNRLMRDEFFEDVKDCRKLTLGEWKRRPLLQRALESVIRLFAPIL